MVLLVTPQPSMLDPYFHITDDGDLVGVDNPKQDRSNLKLDLFVSVLF